jgi:hypothetical protein
MINSPNELPETNPQPQPTPKQIPKANPSLIPQQVPQSNSAEKKTLTQSFQKIVEEGWVRHTQTNKNAAMKIKGTAEDFIKLFSPGPVNTSLPSNELASTSNSQGPPNQDELASTSNSQGPPNPPIPPSSPTSEQDDPVPEEGSQGSVVARTVDQKSSKRTQYEADRTLEQSDEQLKIIAKKVVMFFQAQTTAITYTILGIVGANMWQMKEEQDKQQAKVSEYNKSVRLLNKAQKSSLEASTAAAKENKTLAEVKRAQELTAIADADYKEYVEHANPDSIVLARAATFVYESTDLREVTVPSSVTSAKNDGIEGSENASGGA